MRNHRLDSWKKLKPYHGDGVLFWHEDDHEQLSVLLGLIAHNPGKRQWSIPAGGWDEDSYDGNKKRDYKAATVRETWEEIKLWVDKPGGTELFFWSRHLPLFHFVGYGCQLAERQEAVHYQGIS